MQCVVNLEQLPHLDGAFAMYNNAPSFHCTAQNLGYTKVKNFLVWLSSSSSSNLAQDAD